MMNDIPNQIARKFAAEFASGRKGMSLKEVSAYFELYNRDIPTTEGQFGPPNKPDYFVACLHSLSSAEQRHALADLCDDPPAMKGPVPSKGVREALRAELMKAYGVTPLGQRLSKITLRGVAKDWSTADAKVGSDPASAITAARTLVEATCKTILEELEVVPNDSGNLGRLFKQTRKALKIDASSGAEQSAHQICSGLTTTLQGVASISNLAGDRHGLAGGEEITEEQLARLTVDASGTIAAFLVYVFRSQRDTSEDCSS